MELLCSMTMASQKKSQNFINQEVRVNFIRNIGVVLAFGLVFVVILLGLAFTVMFGISFVNWDWAGFVDAFSNIEWKNVRFFFILGCFVGILVWIFE